MQPPDRTEPISTEGTELGAKVKLAPNTAQKLLQVRNACSTGPMNGANAGAASTFWAICCRLAGSEARN